MTDNGSPTTLTRDQIARLMTPPVETFTIEDFGSVRLRALPAASAEYLQYIEGTAPSPAAIAQGVRQLALNDTQATEVYERLLAKYDYPGEVETHFRIATAAAVLCILDPDTDQPMFTWDDVDEIRQWNRTVLAEIGARATELAAPENLEAAKKASGRTPETSPSTPSA